MNADQRKAITEADERLDAAKRSGVFGARRSALTDLIRAKAAAAPKVDHNGHPFPDGPDDTPPALAAVAA